MGRHQICSTCVRSLAGLASTENCKIRIISNDLYCKNPLMFDVQYLYKFWSVNLSNGGRPQIWLGPDEGKQRHSYWNSFSLQWGVSTTRLISILRYLMLQEQKIRWCQRNPESILSIWSSAIKNANPQRQLRTLELKFYGIISFMFDVEYLYHFHLWIAAMEPNNDCFLDLMEQCKDT